MKIKELGWLVCVGALVVNFSFDWKRRLDFETEKSELREWIIDFRKRLEMETEKAYGLISAFEDRSHQEALILASAHDLLNDLEANTRQIKQDSSPALSVAGLPEAKPIPQAESPKTPVDLLETPLEEIDAREAALKRARTYEAKLADRLLEPDDWQPADIATELQEHYEIQLSPEDLAILSIRLQAYQGQIRAAHTWYASSLDQSLLERIQTEGSDKFSSDTQGPMPKEEALQIFATLSRGNVLMDFKKEDFPELYRRSRMPSFISVVAVEEVRKFFAERSKK